jgi:hypothetical protein
MRRYMIDQYNEMIPMEVVDIVDRARRHCLWRRKDKDNIHSLAAWSMICKPNSKGGLDITNLRVHNEKLLFKHLHKFYNNDDTPWVQLVRDSYYFESVPHAITLAGSFWWKDVFSLSDQYRVITKCEIGDGHNSFRCRPIIMIPAYSSQ